MARGALLSPHMASTSAIDCVEDDEKQKLLHLESHEGEAGGLQKVESHVAGSRPILCVILGRVCPTLRSRKASFSGHVPLRRELPRPNLNSGGDVPTKKLLCHERRPADAAATKLFHQSLHGTVPGIEALGQAQMSNINSFNIVSTLFVALRPVFQWFVSVLTCRSSSTSPPSTGDRADGHESKADHQKLSQEVRRYERSIIQLKWKNRLGGDVSIDGGHAGIDSTDLVIPTVLQRPDAQIQTEGVPSGAIGLEAVAEGVAINIDIEGPGGTTIALGGLSLSNYQHIVLSVCPALSAVDTYL